MYITLIAKLLTNAQNFLAFVYGPTRIVIIFWKVTTFEKYLGMILYLLSRIFKAGNRQSTDEEKKGV